MRLKTIARKRDNTLATDSHGVGTFMCQLAPLELFKIDGVAVKKRSLSTAPDVTIPARGVISIGGEHYLVGTGTPDFWKGEVIRKSYVIQGADDMAELISIHGKLQGDTPVEAHAAVIFNRYLPESADSSKYPPQYQLFLSGSESAPANSLVKFDNEWYLTKDSYISPSGLRIALVNKVDEPAFETITLANNTYDPITDTMTGTNSSVPIFRIKWQEHFTYLTKSSTDYVRGDMQVVMLKSSTAKAPDTLQLSDGKWRVLSAIDETTHWSLHVRRG